jgi:acetyl esterase/lipase
MKPRRDLTILVAAVGVSAGGDIAAIAALAVHVRRARTPDLRWPACFWPAGWRSRSRRRPVARSSIEPMLAVC